MSEARVWTIEVVFTEDDDKTTADAILNLRDRELRGWGRAKRNPADPDIPKIGEELAAARALSDLSHHLLNVAAEAIEEFEAKPAHPHA